MLDFEKIIDDKIINEEKLLLERYQYLNIDVKQVEFILKIFKNKKVDYTNLNINELSSIFSTKNDTTKKIIKNLVINGTIKLTKKDNELKFNFKNLLVKLFNSYFPPSSNSTNEEKIFWLEKVLNINFNVDNINFLNKYISGKWNKILIVTNKLIKSNNENISWPLFETSLKSILKNKINDESDLKEIMKLNWLN